MTTFPFSLSVCSCCQAASHTQTHMHTRSCHNPSKGLWLGNCHWNVPKTDMTVRTRSQNLTKSSGTLMACMPENIRIPLPLGPGEFERKRKKKGEQLTSKPFHIISKFRHTSMAHLHSKINTQKCDRAKKLMHHNSETGAKKKKQRAAVSQIGTKQWKKIVFRWFCDTFIMWQTRAYLHALQLVVRCAVALTFLHPSAQEGVHDKTVSWDTKKTNRSPQEIPSTTCGSLHYPHLLAFITLNALQVSSPSGFSLRLHALEHKGWKHSG